VRCGSKLWTNDCCWDGGCCCCCCCGCP
jgi:hypothetical protein